MAQKKVGHISSVLKKNLAATRKLKSEKTDPVEAMVRNAKYSHYNSG